MKIVIPNPYASAEARISFELTPDSGTISSIGFFNPDFWRGIRLMFHCDEDEEVCGITIEADQIKARFRRIPREQRKKGS